MLKLNENIGSWYHYFNMYNHKNVSKKLCGVDCHIFKKKPLVNLVFINSCAYSSRSFIFIKSVDVELHLLKYII